MLGTVYESKYETDCVLCMYTRELIRNGVRLKSRDQGAGQGNRTRKEKEQLRSRKKETEVEAKKNNHIRYRFLAPNPPAHSGTHPELLLVSLP